MVVRTAVSPPPTLDAVAHDLTLVDGLPWPVVAQLIGQSALVHAALTARLLRLSLSPTVHDDHDDLLTVAEVCALVKLGKARVHELVRLGRLKAVHFGRSVRVPRSALLTVMKGDT